MVPTISEQWHKDKSLHQVKAIQTGIRQHTMANYHPDNLLPIIQDCAKIQLLAYPKKLLTTFAVRKSATSLIFCIIATIVVV